MADSFSKFWGPDQREQTGWETGTAPLLRGPRAKQKLKSQVIRISAPLIVLSSRLGTGTQSASKLRGLPNPGAQGRCCRDGKNSLGAVLSQPVVGSSFMRSAHLENV